MTVLLQARQLKKTYQLGKGNEHCALRNLNLTINEGEYVAIMGPSGSGKSTLLHCISGLDRVSSGSVVFDDQELGELSEQGLATLRLNRMGFVFQQIHLLRNLTLFDNVILGAYHAGRINRKTINAKAEALLTQVGLLELKNNDISQASGGQLQRVGICRALMNDPCVVFGDEPTGALNSSATGDIMSLLATINDAGTTVILATHDVKVASRANRVLFMADGQIVAEKVLGKNRELWQEGVRREQALGAWLLENGF